MNKIHSFQSRNNKFVNNEHSISNNVALSRMFDDLMFPNYRESVLKKNFKECAEQIWQDMGMPKAIKPLIEFSMNPRYSLGAANPSCALLSFPADDTILMHSIGIAGGEKALLIHELTHVRQIYSAARLIGVDELDKILQKSFNQKLDKDFFRTVIDVMGPIEKGSAEEAYAKKCVEAIKNYVDPVVSQIEYSNNKNASLATKLKLKYKYRIAMQKYKNNFLEQDANAAARPFNNLYYKNIARTIGQKICKSIKSIIKQKMY